MNDATLATEVAPRLLAWFEQHGRKHLPWQDDPTPYRVWVSEIMLQQTQVATVIPYFERFMQRFPDVETLAAAPIDEVLHLWSGLGYYARARNLHDAARRLVDEHRGEIPESIEALQALPGVGRSTAGAILALSRRERHPILDGNVRRVLTRCFAIQGWPGERAIDEKLWELSEACTPQQDVAAYTQAIMDLGATVCTRGKPACERCPLNSVCRARAQGLQQTLPTPRPPRRERRSEVNYMLLLTREDGSVLLTQRPARGLWGGLWSLPSFDTEETALYWITRHYKIEEPQAQTLPTLRHSFTHFDLDIVPLRVQLETAATSVAEAGQVWYNSRAPARLGLAAPVTTLIRTYIGVPDDEAPGE